MSCHGEKGDKHLQVAWLITCNNGVIMVIMSKNNAIMKTWNMHNTTLNT